MTYTTKKLDCLLIAPPVYYQDKENIWKEINSNFPPLGLAFLAGHIRSKGYSAKIVDCTIDAPSVDLFEEYFKENCFSLYSEINCIGLTTTTSTIKKAYRIAEICKKYYPEARIIFGGVHATFLPDEVLGHDIVDQVVIGEGEITLEEILSGKESEDICGVAYKVFSKEVGSNSYEIRKTPPRQRITNLDELAMPAYDMLPILKYKPAKGSYKRLPAMAMMTSRGCPGRCTFCSKTLGLQLVIKSAEKIYEEIVYLIDNYGIKQIMFYDDTFTVYKQNVSKLCDMIVQNKIDISWTCFARVDFVDEELLHKMKQAGCHQIMYGVENIDKTVLENIKKKINQTQVENAVKWTKKAHIECRLAFMVGNPGDNLEVINRNIKFVNKLNPDLLIVNITTPFPGTEMFEWAKKGNLISSYDWDDYTLAKPIMKLENLSVEEIKDLYGLMFRRFYFRPRYIIMKILKIRSLDDMKIYFDGFKALVNFFLNKTGNRGDINPA